MSACYVAIDSGGSRTNSELVIVRDGEEDIQRRFEVPDALSGYLPPAQYPAMLRKILAPVEAYLQQRDEDDGLPIHVFISAAGFSASTRDRFSRTLVDVMSDAFSGQVKSVGAANDGITLLLGLGADGVVISGTGSTVIIKSPDGQIHQTGGHDWVASDYGGGVWIGLKAIRRAARDFEEGAQTVLLSRFEELFGIDQEDAEALIARFRSLAVADPRMKADIARFAGSVCAAAELGDVDAQDIVKAEAEDLADATASALRRWLPRAMLSEGISLVQCGSVVANGFYQVAFESQVGIRLLGGADKPTSIEWTRVGNVLDAAMILARRVESDPNSILDVASSFKPVVLSL